MDWFSGSPDELYQAKENNILSAFYVSTENCNVCIPLRVKVENFFTSNYPQVNLIMMRSERYPRWSAEHSVFSAPMLIIFADGKEVMRFGRNISFQELAEKLDRLIELIG